ncbi:MAG TPA: MarR family transcriptional regulator [Dehalococcoidales bacterium]
MVKMVPIEHRNPAVRTFMLFTQQAGATIKYLDSRFYRANKLSMIKYITLRILLINGGTMKHSELARWTNTKKHNITALVDRMKAEQLVTTERSQKDKRVNNVVLTDKGRESFKQANIEARKIVQHLMHGFDENDTHEFERLLHIIKENIERD